MKETIRKILEEKEPPSNAKNKLMASANRYLLAKEIAELFGKNVPSATGDVTDTLSKLSNNKKNENRK